MWKHLHHPNIVSFRGVTFDPLQLVSEWIPGGELRAYVRANPCPNLIKLVSSLLIIFDPCLTTPSAVGRCQWPLLSSFA